MVDHTNGVVSICIIKYFFKRNDLNYKTIIFSTIGL